MATSTLALGQASYELLETLGVKASDTGGTTTLRSTQRGEDFNLSSTDKGFIGQGLRVFNGSTGLTYEDLDVNNPSEGSLSDASVNLLANADSASFNLGGGDNRLNAARDLTNSEVQALDGADNVRIGGKADGSFVALGAGDDQFTVSKSTSDLDVSTGDGNDTALFLGTLTATGNGSDFVSQINRGSNIVDMGDGNDRATFLGGVQGGTAGESGYEIQLGAGNDTAIFGGNSESNGFLLDTGIGSDTVILGKVTDNAAIDLGWNRASDPASGDLVVLGVGATLSDSAIRSGQSNDTLRLAGTVTDTSLDLGWGNSKVEVDGTTVFGSVDSTTVWDLGTGNDSLTFGEFSSLVGDPGSGFVDLGSGADELKLLGTGFGIEFDLGNDSYADTIIFGENSSYSGITISNFGATDILFIGAGSYGYGYAFLNDFANEFDIYEFQQSANVIWQQDEDSGTTDQTLMTLDTIQFTDEDVYDETIVGDLADSNAWMPSTDQPMSENPPTTPTFPENPSA